MKRKLLAWTLALAMVGGLAACSRGTDAPGGSSNEGEGTSYPTDNITMIIPQGLGGGSDLIARSIGMEMEKTLGVSMIYENLGGGSTSIGMEQLADSEPDGYTIGMAMTNLATLTTLGYSDLTCDDFEPIGAVVYDAATILIRTDDERFSNVEELIAYAKDHPGELNWGTGGAGGMWYLAILALCNEAGIEVNIVPNSGGGTGVGLALANGDIDVAVLSPVDCMSQIDAGQIFPIMSMTEERMAAFPDTPTAQELGYDLVILSTRGFVAPKGTPQEVLDVLEEAVKTAAESESYREFIDNMASNWFYLDADEYYEHMKEEEEIYIPLLEQAGLAQ